MAWTLTGQEPWDGQNDLLGTQGPCSQFKGHSSRVIRIKSHSREESHRGTLVAFLSSFTL